jgi:hypothetical protein
LKVQDLLADYLRENKRLSLQEIGIFEMEHLSGSELPTSSESIRFTSDKKAATEDSLLDFLKIRTGKMKSLAQSDLDSFVSGGKQLLNIGKPFEIPGIGVVQKSLEGGLQFQQGIAVAEQLLTEHNKQLIESAEKSRQINPEYYGKKKKGFSKKALLFVAVFLLSVIIWLLFLRKPTIDQQVVETPLPTTDVIQTPVIQDSLSNNPADSLNGFELTVITKKDSIQSYFKILQKSGHAVYLDSTEATDIKIIFRSNRLLSDSALVIDSLQKNFRIESAYLRKKN